ncbi:MAG: hypothetical protein PHE02_07920 [Lachnospiraceae bacterium]|nr:hypothetical protein [Lachnospiraceae bacterium]
MRKKLIYKIGNPYPLGATAVGTSVNFAVALNSDEECGIILYAKSGKEMKIPFSAENRIGNIYCMMISGGDEDGLKGYSYHFYAGDGIIPDPYARKIIGHEKWGKQIELEKLRGGIELDVFDWGEDVNPRLSYEDSILYCMHVRGFTRHHSSTVNGKGTFHGIQEKIPYLKELGVTSLECMPAYEFEEVDVETEEKKNTMSYAMEHYAEKADVQETSRKRMNYWGYKKGYYFAPKAAYAMDKNSPDRELKTLIRELHRQHMEFIMQFYFPKTIKPGFILEVLRFWVLEYHIDGIHLLGEKLPLTLIATDPLFSNTKLMYYDFPCDEIYEDGEVPKYRNLSSYQDNFMIDIRKYLKSDEDMLQSFLFHMRHNPQKEGVIHYITNYNGYTLMDLVSYDRKHNELNGEDNKDGNNYNYSWNCGYEGSSRKKAIQKLRVQQIKNAIVFVLLSQGTPMLLSGDEFGNSQGGNNNAYCQDNAISWLDWQLLEKHQELYQFIKTVIQLRKEHPVLRRGKEAKMMDTLSCGYPDVSYHSEEVWRPIIDNYNRHIAIMYCGKYALLPDGTEDEFFYIAYNMHWITHDFSLPNLPKDKTWVRLLGTSETVPENEQENQITVAPRSITIMISKIKDEQEK